MVSGRRACRPARGVVIFVGVVPRPPRSRLRARSCSPGRPSGCVAGGATTLIADTDNDNVPMARAFADVGWPQTETRIDLVHAGRRGRSVRAAGAARAATRSGWRRRSRRSRSPSASHCTARQELVDDEMPASAAAAGSRLIRMPNTDGRIVRSAVISQE